MWSHHHTCAAAFSLAARFATLALGLSLSACSGGGSSPTSPHHPPLAAVKWSRIYGGLGADSLFAVAGVSADTIYVASERGLLRFDGARWQLTHLGDPEPRLRSMWMSDAHGFAVGDHGAIFRLNHGVWSQTASPLATTLHDVSGVSASAVYACGAGSTPGTGKIIAFNGISWTSLVDAPRDLLGIWAAGINNLFVAGEHGYFAHYSGGVLTPLVPESAQTLRDVWGTSSTNVYAVGDLSNILHLGPGGVNSEPPGALVRWNSIAGTSETDVHLVGDSGTTSHFDGQWNAAIAGADRMLGVWADAGGTAWAVGADGSVLRYSAGWQIRYAGSRENWNATAWGLLVGERDGGGTALANGDSWAFAEPLNGIAAFAHDDAYAVGNSGAIYHFDGTTWTKQTSNTIQNLHGVSGLRNRYGDPIRMYAVGGSGTVLVWKGASWNPASLPPDAAGMNLVSVWAGAIDDVFTVADNSNKVLRYDDPAELSDWTLEATPTSGTLIAITGFESNTYAATSLGEILRNDGNGWKHVADVPGRIRAMQAVARNAFYAVGDNAMLRYYEGGRWSVSSPDYFGDFRCIWARNGFNTFAAGTNGALWIHVEDPQAILSE